MDEIVNVECFYCKNTYLFAFSLPGYLPGFLRPETITDLWKVVANTEGKGHKDGGYGMGWVVIPEKQDFGSCCHQSETVLHTGKCPSQIK